MTTKNDADAIKGILYNDNVQISEEAYYRTFPDAAVRCIRELEGLLERALEGGKQATEIMNSAFAALEKESVVKLALAVEVNRLRPLKEAHEKRMKNLDQSAATTENRQRAQMFRKAVSDFVTARIKQSAALSPKQLVDEVASQPWATKNKRGDPYDETYLLRLISPMVTKAKAVARRSR